MYLHSIAKNTVHHSALLKFLGWDGVPNSLIGVAGYILTENPFLSQDSVTRTSTFVVDEDSRLHHVISVAEATLEMSLCMLSKRMQAYLLNFTERWNG